MVVTHYCHHSGFHAPYPLWAKWWSNTIATFWFLHTILHLPKMVVTHYCHHFGFCAPYPLWCKWWQNTITMTLVLIHHTQYGLDGGHTLLPSFWFPCTIPTMGQIVVKHHYD